MELKQYLAGEKTGTWLDIAKQYNLWPDLPDRSRADKLRRLSNKYKQSAITTLSTGDPNNVLVIGDLHLPFELDGYLEFCIEQRDKFNCGKIVLIGDILDSHFSSYHDTNADGYSAGQELELAIAKLSKWYKAFPEAIATIGNHDRLVHRKNTSGGVSRKWIKSYNEVLEVPNWDFVDQFEHNGILYVHGEQSLALPKAQNEFRSVVSGHHHTEAYVKLLNAGKNFAMQVGTGIDFSKYAFAYAQRGKQPVLSCGVVLNQSPVIIPFYDPRT